MNKNDQASKKIHSKIYMGQICDCLYRLIHHHNRIEKIEQKKIEDEKFLGKMANKQYFL